MRTLTLCGIAGVIFLAGILLQQALYLHCDVSYLISVADQMRHGGQYGNQILETNPPLILYLSLPMLWLSDYFAINISAACRIVVFGWIVLCLGLSAVLLLRLIKEKFLFWSFFLVIESVLLFLPANQFGQREHFFLMMMLPYLWLTVCRLDKKTVGLPLALIVGVIAGIGFAIKPYFLAPLLLVELYVMWRKRSLLAWARPEVFMIITCISLYVITTYIYFPNYFTLVMPLLSLFYFTSMQESWFDMLTKYTVLYVIASLVSYLILRRHDRYRSMQAILALATLGAMLAFLMTRTTWYYHTLPAFGMAIFLFVFLLSEFADCGTLRGSVLYTVALLIVLFLPIKLATIITLEELEVRQQGPYRQLIEYMKSQPGSHSVTCFSANTTADCFPLTTESHSIHASRYPFFWWMRALYAASKQGELPRKSKLGADYLVNTAAEDLNNQRPRWIIINRDHASILFGPEFDMVTFLSQYPAFSRAIKPYHRVATFDYYDVFVRDNKNQSVN